jgi:hypothetical protein
MLRSIVLFTWKPESTDDQRTGVEKGLAQLPDLIPELRRLDFGADAGVRPGNAEFGVVADFDSREDYLVYVDHPAHREVVSQCIRPIMAGRAAIQFEF